MKKTLSAITIVVGSVFSLFAQLSPGSPSKVSSSIPTFNASNPLVQFINFAQSVVTKLVPILIGIAVLCFFWFLIVYIVKGAENEKERTNGVKGMGWSIFALFVMISIWGIISLLAQVLGVPRVTSMPAITLPGQ
jgi:hypothetical protein